MMRYSPPNKRYFRLPNEIFDMRMDPFAFMVYAYLVCCAGSRGECWPSLQTMHRKLGISVSTIQGRIDYLKNRKLIFVGKQTTLGTYKNNTYRLLPLDNPEIYRNPVEPEELPLI